MTVLFLNGTCRVEAKRINFPVKILGFHLGLDSYQLYRLKQGI